MAGIAREVAVAFGVPFREPAARLGPLAAAATRAGDAAHHDRGTGSLRAATSAPSPTLPWAHRRPGWPTVSPPAASGRSATSWTSPITCCSSWASRCTPSIYARLAGPAIVVRRARAGETLRTLDGKQRTLAADMLVIADAERASAIGGVMGGADSEVTDGTTRIVFEAAWFNPSSVRATSRALGLRTEASMRFERGPTSRRRCSRWRARASCFSRSGRGGPPAGSSTSARGRCSRARCAPRPRIAGLLGMRVPDDEVRRILRASASV